MNKLHDIDYFDYYCARTVSCTSNLAIGVFNLHASYNIKM